MLKFRWIPPLRSAGNITFHFTAVPKIPSSYWLKFATQERQVIEFNIIDLVQGSTKRNPEIIVLMPWDSQMSDKKINLSIVFL